jgi:CMP-N-acetylneuraminic acid synthetase
MADTSRTIAIIPARGGSKGVPRKNIRALGGKPLIAWTIEAARNAASIGRIVVSTDDAEIAAVARRLDAEVPFLRPAELAADATPDHPVCRDVLIRLRETGATVDTVAWLRPTAPLRLAADIDAAVALLGESTADSVRSVAATKAHPYWMKTIADGLLVPFVPGKDEYSHPNRQSLPPVYLLNGAVDIVRASQVIERGTMWGERIAAYVMPPERSVDIDTPADFAVAEALLTARGAAA